MEKEILIHLVTAAPASRHREYRPSVQKNKILVQEMLAVLLRSEGHRLFLQHHNMAGVFATWAIRTRPKKVRMRCARENIEFRPAQQQ